MSRFIMPRQGVNGQNLVPGDGAKLHFYTVGTTNNKNTFTDAAKSIASANPVVADATGLFAYIEIDGAYDVVLKDKNGVQLWGPETLQELISGSEDVSTQELTTTTMAANTNRNYDVGDVITTKEFLDSDGTNGGSTYDTVLTSSVTPAPTGSTTNFDIITGTDNALLSFVLRKDVISIKRFGATGDGSTDDTAAIQACFDYAKQFNKAITVPSGAYSLSASLTYARIGEGRSAGLVLLGEGAESVTFINKIAAGGPAIDIANGAVGLDKQFYGMISGIKFTEIGSGANSHGIQYRGCWHQVFSGLTFDTLNGSGINPINTSADADSSAFVLMDKIYANNNSGPGFDSRGATGGLTHHGIHRSYFATNSVANIIIEAMIHTDIKNCSITGQGGGAPNVPGIWLPQGAVQNRTVRIVGGEHGNNQGTTFLIESVSACYIGDLRIVRRTGETNSTKGIDIPNGTTGTVLGVVIGTINLSIDTGTPAWTFVSIGTRLTTLGIPLRVSMPATSAFSTNTYHSFYAGAEDRPVQIEGFSATSAGEMISKPLNRVRTTEATAGTITPDLLIQGAWTQYNLTDAGTYTINKPSNGNFDGNRWLLTIINGGAANVAFGSGITTSGYVDAATPNTAEFRYDATSSTWRQTGNWSVNSKAYAVTVGNVGTGEDDLMTHTIAANTFNAEGDRVRLTAWGTVANNANAKTIKVYFGTGAVLTASMTVSQIGTWHVVMDVIKNFTVQDCIASMIEGGTVNNVYAGSSAQALTTTADIILKVTAEGVANDDIIQKGMIVEIGG